MLLSPQRLTMLVFFLQPIVRGWARYQGSMRAPTSRMARRENLRSVLRQGGHQEFALLEYWNERAVERTEFLRLIIERLDQQGWQHKVDAGWNDYDLQVYGSAWSLVHLVTVEESLAQRKQLLRCRLRARWTLFAKAFFSVMLGAELSLIGFLGPHAWWPFLLLLSLPLFAWFSARDQRDLKRIIAAFIDELASELKLRKIDPQ